MEKYVTEYGNTEKTTASLSMFEQGVGPTLPKKNRKAHGSKRQGKWLWVKNRYPKWHPGKWKH